MKILSSSTYSTYVVIIELEGVSYNVNAQEKDYGWDFYVTDLDEDEEVEKDSELYKQILSFIKEKYSI